MERIDSRTVRLNYREIEAINYFEKLLGNGYSVIKAVTVTTNRIPNLDSDFITYMAR